MKTNKLLWVSVAAVIMIAAGAQGQVPQLINYQGSLADASGNPVNNPSQSMTFKIFDAATAGTLLWQETQTVAVTNGIFNVLLGSAVSIPLTLFDAGTSRWLEVSVGGTALSPRHRFGSVPYAFTSRATGSGSGNTLDQAYDEGGPGAGGFIIADAGAVNIAGPDGLAVSGPLTVASHMNVGLITATTEIGGIDVSGPAAELGFVKRSLTFWPASPAPGDRFVWYNPDGTARLWTHTVGDLMTVTNAGNVGIGTTSPLGKLEVYTTTTNATDNTALFVAPNIGPNLSHIHFGSKGDWYIRSAASDGKVILQDSGGNVGIGTTNPSAKLDVNGTTITKVLQITGGADLSEQFEVNGTNNSGSVESPTQVEPGVIVSIDANNPGKLVVSNKAYDHRVAGIVSGAGGIGTGMLMGQNGSVADGSTPVALAGRVYCWADASFEAIAPGDLLTSSDTPGHAMKVSDYAKAQGTIIGKAMTSLKEGRGLVLVLVSLQ